MHPARVVASSDRRGTTSRSASRSRRPCTRAACRRTRRRPRSRAAAGGSRARAPRRHPTRARPRCRPTTRRSRTNVRRRPQGSTRTRRPSERTRRVASIELGQVPTMQRSADRQSSGDVVVDGPTDVVVAPEVRRPARVTGCGRQLRQRLGGQPRVGGGQAAPQHHHQLVVVRQVAFVALVAMRAEVRHQVGGRHDRLGLQHHARRSHAEARTEQSAPAGAPRAGSGSSCPCAST